MSTRVASEPIITDHYVMDVQDKVALPLTPSANLVRPVLAPIIIPESNENKCSEMVTIAIGPKSDEIVQELKVPVSNKKKKGSQKRRVFFPTKFNWKLVVCIIVLIVSLLFGFLIFIIMNQRKQ